jgi:hypothetical protein
MSIDDNALAAAVRRLFRELAFHDWLVVGYLSILTAAALGRPESPARLGFVVRTGSMLAACVMVLVLVRGGLLRDRFFAPLAHRLAIHGTVQLSYFQFRDFLPFVNPGALDAQLYWMDVHVLHFEPSLFTDRFSTPLLTEWFAFFYFSYFFLIVVHVLPLVYFSRRTKLLAEFALGVLLCFGIGHVLYMIVPGYGPVRELAGQYRTALPEGFWMRLVNDAVRTGGAQKDIFPSLHTAIPVYLALFSFHHRDKLPFRYTWPIVAFFAANIVIATMFLRWHWLIDVVAGLVLSISVFFATSRLSPREVRRRQIAGLSPVWGSFFRASDERM